MWGQRIGGSGIGVGCGWREVVRDGERKQERGVWSELDADLKSCVV